VRREADIAGERQLHIHFRIFQLRRICTIVAVQDELAEVVEGNHLLSVECLPYDLF